MSRKSKKKGASAVNPSVKPRRRRTQAELRKDEAETSAVLLQHAEGNPAKRRSGFWDRRVARTHFTYRAVAFFLLGCILLDLVLYAVFELGFGKCYGILCLV